MGHAAPVNVIVFVDGLNCKNSLCNVELCLLMAKDVLAHEQRLQHSCDNRDRVGRLGLCNLCGSLPGGVGTPGWAW